MADASQMVRVGQRHDATAMLLGAIDGKPHGLLAHNLPVPALAVYRQHRADIQVHLDACVGLEASFQHRINVPGQHANAM